LRIILSHCQNQGSRKNESIRWEIVLNRFLINVNKILCKNYNNNNKKRFNFRYEIFKNENGDLCYTPVGYSTIYEYYAYPDKIRPRISQMLILPPFQRKGLCAKLLNSVYKHYATKSDVIDITGIIYIYLRNCI